MSATLGHDGWVDSLITAVDGCGEEGRTTAAFLRARKTKIGFQRVRRNVGAFWTPFGNIRLNSVHYSYETALSEPRILTLTIHETRHLQQGPAVALSVYGELDAWQLEFRVYRRLTGRELHPALNELMSLPFGWDRAVLRRAQSLMQGYAGKGYRVDLLPLYPLGRELAFRVLGRDPSLK